MTFDEIADTYRWGSQGFVIAVETHGGFGISRTEIERCAARSTTSTEFQHVWKNETDWGDEPDEDRRKE